MSDGKFSNDIPSQTPFLKLLKEVEQYLQNNWNEDFNFDPSVELSHDEYITAHKLYYSLVLKKSFKSHNSIDSFTIPKESFDSVFFEELEEKTNVKDGTGAFTGTRDEQIYLLGKDIKINIVESFSLISMVKHTEVEDQIVVTIKQHKDSFSSSIYYLENDEKSIVQKEQELFDILMKPEEIVYR